MPARLLVSSICLKFNFQIFYIFFPFEFHCVFVQFYNGKVIMPFLTKNFQTKLAIRIHFKIRKDPGSLLLSNTYYEAT